MPMCGRLADPITYRCAAAPFGPGDRDSPRWWCWSGSTLSERSGESPQSLPDVVAGDAIDPFRKPLSESPRHGRGGEVDGYHVLRYGTEHTDPLRAVLDQACHGRAGRIRYRPRTPARRGGEPGS